MAIWKNCKVIDAMEGDKVRRYDRDVKVEIEKGEITVTYVDDYTPVHYRGKEVAPGHYELFNMNKPSGKADLHQFPDSSYMDGYWKEGKYNGFWRIELKE